MQRKPSTPKSYAKAIPKPKHFIAQTWSDCPPELIGVVFGTKAEAQAWCKGFNFAVENPHESVNGTAELLEDVLADPVSFGMKGECSDLLGPLLDIGDDEEGGEE